MCTGHKKLDQIIVTQSPPLSPSAPKARRNEAAQAAACSNACPGCVARHARTGN
jgi:hypothetical protein